MTSTRLKFTIKNARLTLLFNVVLLAVNFFSREIFINHLGNEFLGLAASVTSYIGFLNLAELGIGTALTQALYKPIHDQNREQITTMVSLIGFLFRWVGAIIGVGGLILGVCLPWIFGGEGLPMTTVYLTFFALLATTMLSYLVNYKQILLMAAQRNYIVTGVYNTVLVTKVTTQMVLVYALNMGYVSWLVCEVVFAVCYALWLENRIRRHYPWLRSSYAMGRAAVREHKHVFRNAKNIFSQNIAGKVLLQSDNIVIQNIISLSQVTYYVNYTMLMTRISSLVVGMMSAASSGVGNLVASGDTKKIHLVYGQMNALYFWVAGIMAFGFYTCVNPLLDVWLTDKMIYSQPMVFCLALNLFISIVGRPSEYYLGGYGLFHDVWAAWVQMILNLSISITLTIQYGVIGVVIGTAVSTGLYTLVWKPYFLHRAGFKQSVIPYWTMQVKYLAIIALSWWLSQLIIAQDYLPTPNSWPMVILFGGITAIIYTAISGLLMFMLSSSMRTLVKVGVNSFSKKRE